MQVRYDVNINNFGKIPGNPIVYWISNNMVKNFTSQLATSLDCKTGLICGNNEKYIRFWFEVGFPKINFLAKDFNGTYSFTWFPYNHGGERRRWYGNQIEIVKLWNNAVEMRQEKNAMFRNSEFYFRKGITWNRVGSGVKFAARKAEDGFVFDDVSPSGFCSENESWQILGYMNSKVFNEYLRLFCTALKVEIGHIGKVPYIKSESSLVEEKVVTNVSIEKQDWDAFEPSWDFKKHPLI